jgi:diguanylate cyclase (GGDEF)-like protein/PAS domain S-box-containing protein
MDAQSFINKLDDLILVGSSSDIETASIQSANHAFLEYTHFSQEDILNKPVLDLINVVDHSNDEIEINLIDKTQLYIPAKLYIQKANTSNLFLIKVYANKYEHIHARTESNKYFQYLLEYSSIGLALVDLNGNFITVNKTLITLLEYTEEELLGKSFQDITHPDDLNKDIHFVNDLLSSKISQYEMNKRYYTKSGKVIWAQLNVAVIFQNEKPLHFISQIQDITDKQNYLNDLEMAKSQIDRIINSIPTLVSYVDKNLKYRYVNQKYNDLFNKPTSFYTGKHIKDFLGKNYSQVEKHANLALKGIEQSFSIKLTELTPDDSDFQVTYTPDINKEGKVSGFFVCALDVTENKKREKLLTKQREALNLITYTDNITNLANRSSFNEELEMQINHLNDGFAIFFINIDDFKQINDSLSHQGGDLLLKQIANRLADCTSDKDFLARIGGDEFGAIIRNANSQNQYIEIANKYLACIKDPYQINQHNIYSSISIGIAIYKPGIQAHELLRHADLAMHQAKILGKNKAVVFNEQLEKIATSKYYRTQVFKELMDEENFSICFQPEYSIKKGGLYGFEVLIRIDGLKKYNLTVLDFIEAAEENRTILDIGNWVLNEAFSKYSSLEQLYKDKSFTLSINISMSHITQNGFRTMFKELMLKHNIDPHKIILEFTETALMQYSPNVQSVLDELSSLGVKFAIDDFGTAYSSLSYLSYLPISIIKIDQSFIKNMLDNKHAQEIVKSIITLAHNLNMEAIAEGVETEEQLQFLAKENCDIAQGYLLSKPLFLDQLPKARKTIEEYISQY